MSDIQRRIDAVCSCQWPALMYGDGRQGMALQVFRNEVEPRLLKVAWRPEGQPTFLVYYVIVEGDETLVCDGPGEAVRYLEGEEVVLGPQDGEEIATAKAFAALAHHGLRAAAKEDARC